MDEIKVMMGGKPVTKKINLNANKANMNKLRQITNKNTSFDIFQNTKVK